MLPAGSIVGALYQGCTVTKTSHLPTRYFLALLWAHPILHISTIRVKRIQFLWDKRRKNLELCRAVSTTTVCPTWIPASPVSKLTAQSSTGPSTTPPPPPVLEGLTWSKPKDSPVTLCSIQKFLLFAEYRNVSQGLYNIIYWSQFSCMGVAL